MSYLNELGKYVQVKEGSIKKLLISIRNVALIMTHKQKSHILFTKRFRINYIGQLQDLQQQK